MARVSGPRSVWPLERRVSSPPTRQRLLERLDRRSGRAAEVRAGREPRLRPPRAVGRAEVQPLPVQLERALRRLRAASRLQRAPRLTARVQGAGVAGALGSGPRGSGPLCAAPRTRLLARVLSRAGSPRAPRLGIHRRQDLSARVGFGVRRVPRVSAPRGRPGGAPRGPGGRAGPSATASAASDGGPPGPPVGPSRAALPLGGARVPWVAAGVPGERPSRRAGSTRALVSRRLRVARRTASAWAVCSPSGERRRALICHPPVLSEA